MANKDRSEAAVAAVISVILTPFLLLWDAWVLKVLWGWFAVQTFSLPSLTLYSAMGILLLVSHISPTLWSASNQVAEDENGQMWCLLYRVSHSVIYPLFMLVVGALLHAVR